MTSKVSLRIHVVVRRVLFIYKSTHYAGCALFDTTGRPDQVKKTSLTFHLQKCHILIFASLYIYIF